MAISSKEIARPIPTDFKFSNLKIRDFDLGAAQSVCDRTRCRIRIPIQKLSIVFDLAASALLTAKPLAKLKNLKLEFSPSLSNSVTYVEFEVFVSDSLGVYQAIS